MAYSSVGRIQLAAHAFLLLITVLSLALSARINQFQDFFFVADLFPLALSIITFVFLVVMLLLDAMVPSSYTARPQFHIGLFGILSIVWLAGNAFSTSRWRHIPMACGAIPDEFADERSWCKDVQALKAFVWIEWVTILFITLFTARYALSQNSRGNKHIFKEPLSRYTPKSYLHNHDYSYGQGYGYQGDGFANRRGNSEFLQFPEKFN